MSYLRVRIILEQQKFYLSLQENAQPIKLVDDYIQHQLLS